MTGARAVKIAVENHETRCIDSHVDDLPMSADEFRRLRKVILEVGRLVEVPGRAVVVLRVIGFVGPRAPGARGRLGG